MSDVKKLELEIAFATEELSSLNRKLVRAQQESGGSVLNVPMNPERNDAEAKSMREYLKALLHKLIAEQEGFNSKRPFGNSGWIYELFEPLVIAGIVDGEISEDEGVIEVECTDDAAAMSRLREAIDSL